MIHQGQEGFEEETTYLKNALNKCINWKEVDKLINPNILAKFTDD